MKKQNKKRTINFQNIQLKGNFSKKYMIMLNVIQCTTFAREGSNMDVSFDMMIVKIYITNYVYQNTTRNTFQFQKISVTAATKKKIQTTVHTK
jgi:hypothetical protein